MSRPKGKGTVKQRAKGPPTSFSPSNPSPSPAPPPPRSSVSSFPASAASSSTSTPLPPSMPKRCFLRRVLPLLLTANFAVGAYVLARNQKKRQAEKKDEGAAVEGSAASVESTNTTVPEETWPKEHKYYSSREGTPTYPTG